MRKLPLLLLALPAGALAAPVSITVTGGDGRPLAGAVVEVQSARAPAASTALPGPFAMAQKDIAFQPRVLIVPVGAAVTFPNRDQVRHHVYSFSTPKRFELKLYGRDETRAVIFDKPGVVAVGCNIHDQMSGFIIVTDTPYTAQSDARGRVSFDVPAGAARVTIWHPSIRAPGNMVMQGTTVGLGGLATTIGTRR